MAVHFDGYGDDGTTEEGKCYDSEYYAWGEHEPVKYDASHLQEHFETLVPFGYENDCGGFGDVVLDVTARKITIVNSDGKPIPVRYVGEQHVREDLGRIPTAQDWLFEIKPQRWMHGQRLDETSEREEALA